MINLSELIKSIRKERKLSQSQIAEMLGVTQQAVAKYENGMIKYPSPAIALRIEQVTGGAVTRDSLVFPELYEQKDQKAA